MRIFEILIISSFLLVPQLVTHAQQAQSVLRSSGPIFAEINMQDLVRSQTEMTNHVVNLNATYLTIALGILVGLSAIFYHFNLKPLNDDIKKQREDIKKSNEKAEAIEKKLEDALDELKSARKHNEESLEALKKDYAQEMKSKIENLEEKTSSLTQELEKKLARLEMVIDRQQAVATWQEHYLWETRGVFSNVMTTLLEGIEENDYMKNKHNSTPIGDLPLNKFIEKLEKEKEKMTDRLKEELIENITKSNKLQKQTKEHLLRKINL